MVSWTYMNCNQRGRVTFDPLVSRHSGGSERRFICATRWPQIVMRGEHTCKPIRHHASQCAALYA
jgi:hypothetical protein